MDNETSGERIGAPADPVTDLREASMKTAEGVAEMLRSLAEYEAAVGGSF